MKTSSLRKNRSTWRSIVGKKFGRLKVIGLSRVVNRTDSKYLRPILMCLCKCGNKKEVRINDIGRGVNSCGCLRKETASKVHIIHGMKNTLFYRCWSAMKNRCLNTKNIAYKNYGFRKIKVCKRWLDFRNFKKDMYQSYINHSKKFGSFNTTIERINNNGNYCHKNCKWATRLEQAKNKRNARLIKINGVTKTLTEWSDVSGKSVQCIYYRLKVGYKDNKIIE